MKGSGQLRETARGRTRRLALGLVLLLGLSTSLAVASTGSNQGGYGTNFAPAVLTGKVTLLGAGVSGAAVSTTAGHSTSTDASGDYTLYLDTPGIYDSWDGPRKRCAGAIP